MESKASLNPDQLQAVETRDGPLLVVAGPGSGKTRVMTQRIAHLLATGVPPECVLAITFTNKAADEMLERTLALLDEDSLRGAPPLISTFHSFCARLLRREIYHLEPYNVDFTIYDSDDQKGVIEEALKRLSLDKTSFPPSQLSSRISRWKNEMVAFEEAADGSHTFRSREIARVYGVYQRLLMERNALDFDDLLLLTLRVLREVEHVRARRQDWHQYVMIDEFQDTNRPQYLIARILADRHHNLCITGDPDQSIYSWRGASPENFDRFAKDFPEHRTVFLNQNYRSTPEILTVASRLTATAVGERALFTENPSGDDVVSRLVGNERDEAQEVVRLVERWSLDGTPYRNSAVLYRVNSMSRSIEEELVRAGIPYTIVGGVAFYQRKEVKDILGYLRAATFLRDDVALRRVINTPTRGFGKVSLEKLEDVAAEHQMTLGEVVRRPELWDRLSARARTSLDAFRKILEQLAELRKQPLAVQIRTAIEETGYIEHLQKVEPESWSDRQENLDELVNAASETEELWKLRPKEEGEPQEPLIFFLERIALVSDVDQWEERDDRVAMMTLHAAKGLEFDRVIIAGVEERLLPLVRNDEETDLDEERRLFYVGITRARQTAVLLHAQTRWRFREREPRLPSSFLQEISGPGLVHDELFAGAAWKSQTTTPRSRTAQNEFDDPYQDFDQDVYVEEEGEEFCPGAWLEHDIYGRGIVKRTSGFGASKRITVLFEEHGEKQMVLSFAPIRVISAPDDYEVL